jgi:N-acetylglutamate synthase
MNDTFSEAELRRIEEISQNASRPERGAMVDGWSVGLSPSKAKRSRCVNAFYPSARSFETNLAAVRALYRSAQLPCVFRLTRFVSDPTIDEKLAARGGTKFDETHVQLCRLMPSCVGVNERNNRLFEYSIFSESSPESIGRIVQELRGDSDQEIEALVERWQSMPFTLRSYTAMRTGAPAAHALTIEDDGCIGIFDVVTHEAHRGHGLATHLLSRALNDAYDAGARIAYLQVVGTNPARRVYERLGFQTAYTYWYRQLPEM